jgi:homopolymeric O-antigen transport system ATP-binding protein
MSQPAVTFNHVWKKFRRGERHDSLRDAITALAKRPFQRRAGRDQLADQEFWALRDVSFEVQPGEALGIIGPNGAGKSTALKLLTRILRPTMGSCSIRGRVGALIEVAAGFHPDLTGRENVFLQGAILGMTRQEVTQKLDAVVEFSGIGDFIDTPVKRYSSGMNARLGFSIAAHMDPAVLVIDEVLAVGDQLFQQKCLKRLEEFKRSGATIVFVSHNMQAIVSLCERALLLRPQQAPILDDVDKVAALYASVDSGITDPRVKIHRFVVSESETSLPLQSAVAPGAALTLDVEIEANTSLPRCGFHFEVVRTDGLKMFNHTPMAEGEPPFDLESGARLKARIHFRANVLRGTYRILLYLTDSDRDWEHIELSGLASFVVHETTRLAGCAELTPSYQLQVVRPALTR